MTLITKYQKPIWTEPQNLKDNTIITVTNWNNMLSNVGSAAYVQQVSNKRAACNVFVAEWDFSVPIKSSTATGSTVVTFASISNGAYFNKTAGIIVIPEQTPFLALWRVRFVEPSFTEYNFRTTLNRTAVVAKTPVTTVIASHFLRKYDNSQTYFDAAYAGVSNKSTDKYRITVAHGYHSSLRCIGHLHLILNPGMV
jgi:hypothetical protein